MSKIAYGLNELRAGDFDPVTGEITNMKVIAVFKDTFHMEDDDPTENKFYQAGKKSARLVRGKPADDVVEFSLMEVHADNLAFMFGGTVTVIDGRKRWNQPKGFRGELIKGLEIDTEDGSMIRVPRGSWSGKKSFKDTESDIYLIPVKVTATDTGLAEVADFTWDDPIEEEDPEG